MIRLKRQLDFHTPPVFSQRRNADLLKLRRLHDRADGHLELILARCEGEYGRLRDLPILPHRHRRLVERSRPRAADLLHTDILNTPVRQSLAVHPPVEEFAVVAAGVGIQFGAIVLRLEHAPAVLGDERAREVEESGFAEFSLEHAEGLGTAIVGAREEAEELLVLRQVLRRGVHLAVSDRVVRSTVAIVVAIDVRQPCQPLRPFEEGVVLAALDVHEAMGEMHRRALVHEWLAVAVGAHEVVPPLVARLVRDEVFDVSASQMRHVEDALVDHHEARALVSVPAEERLHHREPVIRVVAEPLRVDRDRLGDDLQDLGGVELVFWECQASELHRFAVGELGVACELLEPR